MLDYISLLLGAFIGFLGSVGMFFVQEWWYSRATAKLLKTEISLILKSIDAIITSINEDLRLIDGGLSLVDMPTPRLDTQFYETSTEKLSLVNPEKVSKIKTFYFLVSAYQHAIEKASLNRSDVHTFREWLKKALETISRAKKLGTELLSDL